MGGFHSLQELHLGGLIAAGCSSVARVPPP